MTNLTSTQLSNVMVMLSVFFKTENEISSVVAQGKMSTNIEKATGSFKSKISNQISHCLGEKKFHSSQHSLECPSPHFRGS